MKSPDTQSHPSNSCDVMQCYQDKMMGPGPQTPLSLLVVSLPTHTIRKHLCKCMNYNIPKSCCTVCKVCDCVGCFIWWNESRTLAHNLYKVHWESDLHTRCCQIKKGNLLWQGLNGRHKTGQESANLSNEVRALTSAAYI